MKKFLITALVLAAAVAGCDLIDGTQVRNPDLLLNEAVNQPNSAQSWVRGLDRRIAFVYNDHLITAELTSDNYENKATFFNQNVDGGTFRYIDDDFDDAQFQIGRLREQAEYGLETVLEADPGASGTELEAEMHFYKGWAHLLAGELFVALPAEALGTPQSPEFHFQAAINAFTQANSITSQVSYDLALARAHYNLGNRNEAVQFAQQVLSADNEFLRVAEYDAVNEPVNDMQDAAYDRQNFNDLQPLPRLDFLDPKYGDLPGVQESPVIMQSAEEAYLIIAEAQLSDGAAGLPLAQQTLLDLLDLVGNREVREFDETEEGRTGTSSTVTRPNSSDFRVRADADSPFKEGLILDRTVATPVPVVSGTSVTSGDILGTTNPNGDALELLYLMRQEVFFGEGRRMADLGVKWPVSEIEYLNNENVTDAHIQAHIPSYMPSPYSTINAFSVNGNDVTIAIDMNKVIAAQRGNKFN